MKRGSTVDTTKIASLNNLTLYDNTKNRPKLPNANLHRLKLVKPKPPSKETPPKENIPKRRMSYEPPARKFKPLVPLKARTQLKTDEPFFPGVNDNEEDYKFGDIIGKGANALVRKCIKRENKQVFAVKTYEKAKVYSRRSNITSEVRILESLEHPNIVKLFEVIETPRHIHLVMEYIPGISLKEHLKKRIKLDEFELKKVFRQILCAVEYCHTKMVSHRDLKLDNIIVDNNASVKLLDFGFATEEKESRVFCGTPSYMAPEIVTRKTYDGHSADVWALGIVLFTLTNGFHPFKGNSDQDLYQKISMGFYSHSHTSVLPLKALLGKMLVVNPKKRLTVRQILWDRYFI